MWPGPPPARHAQAARRRRTDRGRYACHRAAAKTRLACLVLLQRLQQGEHVGAPDAEAPSRKHADRRTAGEVPVDRRGVAVIPGSRAIRRSGDVRGVEYSSTPLDAASRRTARLHAPERRGPLEINPELIPTIPNCTARHAEGPGQVAGRRGPRPTRCRCRREASSSLPNLVIGANGRDLLPHVRTRRYVDIPYVEKWPRACRSVQRPAPSPSGAVVDASVTTGHRPHGVLVDDGPTSKPSSCPRPTTIAPCAPSFSANSSPPLVHETVCGGAGLPHVAHLGDMAPSTALPRRRRRRRDGAFPPSSIETRCSSSPTAGRSPAAVVGR